MRKNFTPFILRRSKRILLILTLKLKTMNKINASDIKGKLYIPAEDSHKGQNGKLLIIGGSHLFHAASLWALKVASRIVDMVFYSSVPENNELVMKMKEFNVFLSKMLFLVKLM